MPRLSLGLGVSSSSKLPAGTAAPAGIPTAGPLMGVNVNVAGLLQLRARENEEGIYYTVTDGYWLIGPGEDNVPVDRLFFAGGVWQFISNHIEPPYDQSTNSTPNQSVNYIPTTGWSPSITITAPTFPNVATTSVVNALINTSDATTTSYLQSVGFAAVGGVHSVPLTKQVPPSQNYYSVEYKTTFSDGGSCYLLHSTAASNRWFFFMEKFAYYDEEFGDQYSTLISIFTTAGLSNATIPAARSTYAGTNLNSMVSPNCFS